MYKYQHGGDIYSRADAGREKKIYDYSVNINPLGVPAGVKQALKKAVDACVHYPDPFCRELAKETAGFLETRPEYLFFGNGAADLLFRLVLALKPRHALILAPTFADYEKALRAVACSVHYYDLYDEKDFVAGADILKKITKRIDLVIICNPNNPTGKLIPRALMEKILAKCRATATKLLVDECFMDFVAREKACSVLDMVGAYPELIILKAFTKTYAIPGVRLGFCLSADAELQQKLHQCGQDWSVSVLAQLAGRAALKESAYLEKSFALIGKERIYLSDNLARLGARLYGSEANYIFFYLPQPLELLEILRERGYLIRSCANYRNLDPGYYRIGVKTHRENRGLVNTLKEVLQHARATDHN